MRVAFGEDALAERSAHRYLTEIFWMFVDGRHAWEVDDPGMVLESAWYRNEGRKRQQEIEEQLKALRRWPGTRGPLIVVSTRHQLSSVQWKLEAQEARDYLRRPLSIFVENLSCDGLFFALVMLRVGEKKLIRRLGQDIFDGLKANLTPEGVENWFRVEHGGGSTLSMCIKRRCESSGRVPPAIFSFVDSDKRHPQDDIGQTAEGVIEICRDVSQRFARAGWQPQWWVLEKREVENYIPMNALQAHVQSGQRALSAFRALSETQKAFYNMKGGFRADLDSAPKGTAPPNDPAQWKWKDAQHQALYQLLSPDDMRALLDGFGKEVSEALRQDAYIHDASLRESAGNRGKELDKMIDTVLELL